MARQSLAVLLALGLIASLLVAAPVVRAQEEEVEEPEVVAEEPEVVMRQPTHPLTNMAESAPGVSTSYIFTKYTEDLPIGEPVTAVCAFTNDGAEALNITAIMGSLNAAAQFSFHIQNFTHRMIDTVVEPGQEIALAYSFTVDPEVEPYQYSLALTVFYEDEDNVFTTTYFNETRNFVEPPTSLDLKGMLVYVIAAAVVGGIAMLVLRGSTAGGAEEEVIEGGDDWSTASGAPTSTKRAKKSKRNAKKNE